VVPKGHDFRFFGPGKVIEKSWKMIFQKQHWSPWLGLMDMRHEN